MSRETDGNVHAAIGGKRRATGLAARPALGSVAGVAMAFATTVFAPLAAALAEDIPVSNPGALLDEARAHIAAEAWPQAINALRTARPMAPNNADLHNLLGFALRKSGDLSAAGAAYDRALTLDPDHLGALEYQGELFLMLGRPDAAAANLARLEALCGACEEYRELAATIAAGGEADRPRPNRYGQ